MSDAELVSYLSRPLSPAEPETLAAIAAGPIEPAAALPLTPLDRLLDPAPLAVETGWCTLSNGVGYVAVRTPMPAVSAEMVEWWFDWHPRESIRYRIWHPQAHRENSLEPPAVPGAKAHWGAVHHPVEDVGIGIGIVHARIAFKRPSEFGFSTDVLDDPAVATIVCGEVGDDHRRVRHSAMAHVFLRDGDGVVLRSHFWLGALTRPYLPAPLASLGARVLNNRVVRRLALPAGLPQALAEHCAEEYANLAALLPELHRRFTGKPD
jgi:phloretin hydrolase